MISKSLIDSSISHDEFALINNVLKEYVWRVEKILKVEIHNLHGQKMEE